MDKEKQIEEMVEVVKCKATTIKECPKTTCDVCKAMALYKAGYRKQSEGEWRPYKTPIDARQTGWICSCCSSVIYDLSNGDTDFCPHCGAKMKGGAE